MFHLNQLVLLSCSYIFVDLNMTNFTHFGGGNFDRMLPHCVVRELTSGVEGRESEQCTSFA